jgi:MFS family permease
VTIDGWLLFAARSVRLFAYGLLSVVLVFHLAAVGLGEGEIGALLTLTLLGDTAISLWLTTSADRLGRRRTLIVGGVLMTFAAALFAGTDNFWLLLVAATVGVISPSGNEVGPFLPVEQAALSQMLPSESRTSVFAWYNLVGSLATALGSLVGGLLAQLLQNAGWSGAGLHRPLLLVYGVLGLLLAVLFACLSPAVEAREVAQVPGPAETRGQFLGLHRSQGAVLRLSALFALDAFGGGFVVQGIVAYWFHLRFGVEPGALGGIFFGANLLAGFSALAAGWLAGRIGLVNTMVFTHLPSNVLLLLVPFMPTLPWAVAVLLLRFSISQMDVPARQAFTMEAVTPDERSAASGVTGVARSLGAALSPSLAALLLGSPALLGLPFILAGSVKIVYDLLLYRGFVTRQEETRGPAETAG